MKFVLEIDLDNAAFDGDAGPREVKRLLWETGNVVGGCVGPISDYVAQPFRLRDINGNICGKVEIVEFEEEQRGLAFHETPPSAGGRNPKYPCLVYCEVRQDRHIGSWFLTTPAKPDHDALISWEDWVDACGDPDVAERKFAYLHENFLGKLDWSE